MEDNQLVLLEGESRPVPVYPAGFYTGKPRPGYSAPEVFISVVDRLMPEIMRWGKFEEHEAESVAEQVLSAFKHEDQDGYRLARYLEKYGSWDSDSELSEILEGADFYRCHKEATKAWIKDNSAVPSFVVGREVSVKERRQSEMLTGKIRDITDDGMYCVMVPSLGHVESGLGTHGLLFPWEDVEVWNAAAESI